MVQAMRAFLDFCYIARRDILDTGSLSALDDALQRFHLHREIFQTSGIRPNGFSSLPRQLVFEGPVARTEKDRATERNRTDRNRTVGCGCSSPEIFSVAGLMV
jgi:hypothetical protein